MISRAALSYALRIGPFRVGHRVGIRPLERGRAPLDGGLSLPTITHRCASSRSADEVMDDLQELYSFSFSGASFTEEC